MLISEPEFLPFFIAPKASLRRCGGEIMRGIPQKISGEIVGQTPPGDFAHALPLLLWLPPHCDNHSEGIPR